MVETIRDFRKWNWADIIEDLRVQGGLDKIFIDPLTIKSGQCRGMHVNNPFCITWNKDKYLFPGEYHKRPMRTESIYRVLVRLQRRLGIDQSISPHKFRHSFAKKFIKKGGA